ncbi:MAG: dehypoxanthine futalosine cyclase [Bacteroidales bacterium]|nr:dehypoxanthine futalosine cyclase [Bacteroidales bacterium]
MNLEKLYNRSLDQQEISVEEACFLFENAPTSELMLIADSIRKELHPDKIVTWIIDRNVNITNVCVSGCQFCNFYKSLNHPEAYITTLDQYKKKIEELYSYGGKQLLIQGGMHPELGLDFYLRLFRDLKTFFPDLKLHALGPPEIVHLSEMEKQSYKEILTTLIEAGMDSLPGAGAEILVERVRSKISRNKCTAKEWLDVMRAAHHLGISTSATMMFGHIETIAERMEHLVAIRRVQNEKPVDAIGFVSFIPWPFQAEGTVLKKRYGVFNKVMADEYVRLIAISRIMLPNINNIQASWLTVGKETAQLCLHGGANDFGSVMIEENVVSKAGADHQFDIPGIQEAIREAGFEPQLRNQRFEFIELLNRYC